MTASDPAEPAVPGGTPRDDGPPVPTAEGAAAEGAAAEETADEARTKASPVDAPEGTAPEGAATAATTSMDAPAEETPAGEPPADATPAEHPAGGDAPAEETRAEDAPAEDATSQDAAVEAAPAGRGWRSWMPSRTGVAVVALCGVLGVGLAAQLRSNDENVPGPTARQDDLVRILDELESREARLRNEIAVLQQRRQTANSANEGSQAALQDVRRRAEELGILAGTLPAQGSGLEIEFQAGTDPLPAYLLLDAVEELRGAGAEAMQVAGDEGNPVRIIASTSFVDADGGIEVDGRRLEAPYRISVIGDPTTMHTALRIAGGVMDSVENKRGRVQIVEMDEEPVTVTAVRAPRTPRYARPAS